MDRVNYGGCFFFLMVVTSVLWTGSCGREEGERIDGSMDRWMGGEGRGLMGGWMGGWVDRWMGIDG